MKKTYLLSVLTIFFTTHLSAQIITTIAGNGTLGYFGDGGPATNAELNNPVFVTVDGGGNIYIVDQYNHCIRKVNTAGVMSTVAGNGTSGFIGDGGPATNAELAQPESVAVDAMGNIYIADLLNERIRKVNTADIISTFAGNGTGGFFGDGGPATAAELFSPWGVAIDATGNVYIADVSNNRVRKVNPSGDISTIAGNGTLGFSGDGTAATTAELNQPTNLGLDASGNIYIADRFNHCIRQVNTSGIISTVAGTGGTIGFFGDGGAATVALLDEPMAVSVDATGDIYIADCYNHRIRKVTTAGMISTIAGNGTSGYFGDGGPATNAELNYAAGVAIDALENIYIADLDNYRIRKVTPAVYAITGTTTLCTGSSLSLSDATTGGAWSSGSTGIATVGSGTGVVSAISAGTDIITYTVGVNSVMRTITVNPTPSLTSSLTPPAICDTTLFKYTPTSAITGTIFSWSRASIAGISNAAATGTGSPNELLVNTTTGPVSVIYVYALSASGCADTENVTVKVNQCKPTIVPGISDPAETIKVYPNPNNGSFTVEIPPGKNNTWITISDILGKVIGTRNIDGNATIKQAFELNNLPKGTYIIKVDADDKTYRQKIGVW